MPFGQVMIKGSAAAIVHDLLAVLEWRVPGHSPARRIVRIGIGTAPVIVMLHIFFKRRLLGVRHTRLVECSIQTTLAAGAVVGGDHNESVVVLPGAQPQGLRNCWSI